MNPVSNSDEENIKTALTRAKNWCAFQEQCVWDINQRLIKLELSHSEINLVIEQLIKEGFLNEQRYADAYVSGKFRISKWGRIKIASGLRMKQIPEKMIASALNSIDLETYRDCLVKLLKKKEYELRKLPADKSRLKLTRFALQKGYESDLVYQVINSKEK
jgi:regulatory protein